MVPGAPAVAGPTWAAPGMVPGAPAVAGPTWAAPGQPAWPPPTTAVATGSGQEKPGPGYLMSLTLIVASLVLFGVSLSRVIQPFVNEFFDAPVMSVPGSARLHLDPGDYLVYIRTGAAGSAVGNVRILTPSQVSVTGPDGVPLDLSTPSAYESIGNSNGTYSGQVAFHVSSGGTYTVRINAEGPGQALIALSLGGLLHSVVGWIAACGVAVLMGITGVVLLIVTIVRRQSAKRQVIPGRPYGY